MTTITQQDAQAQAQPFTTLADALAKALEAIGTRPIPRTTRTVGAWQFIIHSEPQQGERCASIIVRRDGANVTGRWSNGGQVGTYLFARAVPVDNEHEAIGALQEAMRGIA
jgi:hypothetical protein